MPGTQIFFFLPLRIAYRLGEVFFSCKPPLMWVMAFPVARGYSFFMTRLFRITPAGMAMVSVAVGLAVLGIKYVAYLLTGSVALYSDAIESVVNVVAAAVAWVALRAAAAPPDEHHPYGHHKAEYFSAGLEGALIVLAAALIVHEAWQALWVARDVDFGWIGLAVNAFASLLNAAWGWALIREGRLLKSPALVADGKHLWADVYSSIGVLVGVLLAKLSGWHLLDPLLALAVAANIVWSGWRLMRESFGGLMDEAVGDDILARIDGVIAAKKGVALEVHDLKTRKAGRAVFVEFHLVVPAAMTVRESHAICDALEGALEQVVEGVQVTIHVEPEEKAKKPVITG